MMSEANEDRLGHSVRTEIFSNTLHSLRNTIREQSAWRKHNPEREPYLDPLWKRPTRYVSVGNERIRLEIAELKGLMNRNPLQTVCGNLILDPAQIAKRREDRIQRKLLEGSYRRLRKLSCRNIIGTTFNNQLFLNVFFTERYRNKTTYLVTACAAVLVLVTVALMPKPVEQQVEHKLLQAWHSIGNYV